MLRTCWLWLWCCVVCAQPASNSYDQKLAQADAVRSTDPAQFQLLLDQLGADVAQATPAQLEYLHYLRAYQRVIESQYPQAIQEASSLLDKTGDTTLKFRAGLLLAISHAANRDFAAGLGRLGDALALAPQISDRDILHNGWITSAVLYNQLGQYELGLTTAELVLRDQPSDRSRCFAGHLQLESLSRLDRLSGDEKRIESVIADCSAQNEAVAANFARVYLAHQWADAGNTGTAVKFLLAHLPEVAATRYPMLLAEFHSLLAEYQLQLGELAAAQVHGEAALENSQKARFSWPRVSAWFSLYQIAQRRGDAKKALEYYRSYAEADKAYVDDIKARELAVQMAQHESQRKNQMIELLNKENQVLQLQQKVSTQSAQNKSLLIALLVLMLVFIGYWANRIKRVQNVFRQLAQIDSLTGVNNRHYFHAQAEAALLQCAGNKLQASLIMFDLDHFKTINDRFGHATGDWVLRRVADTAKKLCRDRDYIGRLGGEEFAILLIGADSKAGAQLAEQCRAAIAAIDTRDTGFDFPVAASFGVCDTRSAGHEFRLMLSQADNATYRSKHNGRNQVSVYDESADRVHPGATHGASTGHLLREV